VDRARNRPPARAGLSWAKIAAQLGVGAKELSTDWLKHPPKTLLAL